MAEKSAACARQTTTVALSTAQPANNESSVAHPARGAAVAPGGQRANRYDELSAIPLPSGARRNLRCYAAAPARCANCRSGLSSENRRASTPPSTQTTPCRSRCPQRPTCEGACIFAMSAASGNFIVAWTLYIQIRRWRKVASDSHVASGQQCGIIGANPA